MKLLSILILTIALYEAHANKKRYCGKVLTQVLEAICVEGYNSHITKKSETFPKEFDDLDSYNDVDNDSVEPIRRSFWSDLLLSGNIDSLVKTRRRRSMLLIHEECCIKSCDQNELASYCKSSKID